MARLQSDWILEKETAYLILERFLFTSRFGAWSYSGLRGVFFLGRLSPFNHQKSHNIEILWCFWRFLLKRFYRLHNFLAHFYQPLVLWSYGWSWGFLGTFVPFGLPWSNFETFKTLGKILKSFLHFYQPSTGMVLGRAGLFWRRLALAATWGPLASEISFKFQNYPKCSGFETFSELFREVVLFTTGTTTGSFPQLCK